MSRQEAYAEIKKLGLADGVKKKFGRNFTQVGTNDLIAFINKNSNKKPDTAPVKSVQKEEVKALREEMEKTGSASSKNNTKYASVIAAIARFLAFLPKEVIDEAAETAKNLTPETVVEEVDFSNMSIDELKRQFGH